MRWPISARLLVAHDVLLSFAANPADDSQQLSHARKFHLTAVAGGSYDSAQNNFLRQPAAMKSLSALVALAASALLPAVGQAAWEFDPSHTHVSFEVGHLGLTRTPGIFRKVQGEVKFDLATIEASKVSITIDSDSIDTAQSLRDADLRKEDWFDAGRNPKITFVSRSVKALDAKNFIVTGDLTLRGVTRPVDFKATLTNVITNPFLKVPAVGFVATASVKRTDYGMAKFLQVIDDEVLLKIQLEMNNKP
ncbi:MAG: putative polyprenyl-pyrophosphate binding protein [Ramlibacter sp.]|nr:putative polyprenyl-pyrophosphate binding protein [Ramlibacter sp.]